jgi:hypothetical protein
MGVMQNILRALKGDRRFTIFVFAALAAVVAKFLLPLYAFDIPL